MSTHPDVNHYVPMDNGFSSSEAPPAEGYDVNQPCSTRDATVPDDVANGLLSVPSPIHSDDGHQPEHYVHGNGAVATGAAGAVPVGADSVVRDTLPARRPRKNPHPRNVPPGSRVPGAMPVAPRQEVLTLETARTFGYAGVSLSAMCASAAHVSPPLAVLNPPMDNTPDGTDDSDGNGSDSSASGGGKLPPSIPVRPAAQAKAEMTVQAAASCVGPAVSPMEPIKTEQGGGHVASPMHPIKTEPA